MENDIDGGDGIYSMRMSLRERPQRKSKNKVEELKFMTDFDPEKSNREKRKLKRKVNNSSKTSIYDEYGHIRTSGMNVCDCMNNDCPGCWFDCPSCGSNKCGVQCRVNRKFYYESITFDGKDAVIHNKNFQKK